MKIDKLTLKNFKFFYGEKTLSFDGKNVLIYGENGSGKSSIYWALYTLLNNANSAESKIKRYFSHRDDKRLLNRYISESDDGKIAITLNNAKSYAISAKSAVIQEYKRGNAIREASIASDFINYKLLAKLYEFKHGESIDLFGLFESDIFDYMPYDSTKTYAEAWKELRRIETAPPSKGSWSYNQFVGQVDTFNNNFKSFINSIKQSTNESLQQYFDAKYEVVIGYKDMSYHNRPSLRKDRRIILPQIPITIKLTDKSIEERNKRVKQPHTFLNEAKLTAIALSLRLAILQQRVTGKDILKVLILDDLLISLDMSNRDIVLKILLEDQYLKDYQIIMLTHDKAFYEKSKDYFDYKAKDKWKFFEMYLDKKPKSSFLSFELSQKNILKSQNPTRFVGDIELPYIIKYTSQYTYSSKAEEYFKKRDYPASATYLRKELEKLYYKKLDLGKLESLIILGKKIDNYEKLVSCFPLLIKAIKSFEKCESIPIDKRVKKCTTFADKVKKAIESVYEIIEQDDFFDIGMIKDHILNPQSHHDYSKPLYKKELEDAFKAVEKLQQAVESNIHYRISKKRTYLKNRKTRPEKLKIRCNRV